MEIIEIFDILNILPSRKASIFQLNQKYCLQKGTFMKEPKPVRKLPPETARKIAAGEVIDRPNAIVRELLDNAIDAASDSVCLEIEGGGIDKIRVVDNGFGMSREDLENSVQPHATSKIADEKDLLELNTLGFRGEALASIAAVARLDITTIRRGEIANKLSAFGTAQHQIAPCSWNEGTAVEVRSLFENFPARRVFLKKPAAEAKLCKQTFLEKAIPWTEIEFKFVQDGKLKYNFAKNQSRPERFAQAMEAGDQSQFFSEIYIEEKSQGFSFYAVLGAPELRKTDKKNIYIFVNGRRIWEYSLVQAIEYGAQGYFPNGTFPQAALFLQIDPHLVDFNIHPAKREAKFRDIGPIHHSVSTAVRNFYRQSTIAGMVSQLNGSEENENFSQSPKAEEAVFDFGKEEKIENFENAPAFGGHNSNFSYDSDLDINQIASRASAASFAGSGYTPNKNRDFSDFNKTGNNRDFEYSYTPNRQSGSVYTPKAEAFLDGGAISADAEPKSYTMPDFAKMAANLKNAANAQNSTNSGTNNFMQPPLGQKDIRYFGTALGVFLLVEKNSTLYLIDQHAAHERILFDRFMASLGSKQKLLFPYVISTESDADDQYLENLRGQMEKIGFDMEQDSDGKWQIASVPVKWNGTEEDLRRDLLEKRMAPEELTRKIAAFSSCRAAVKDGTILDEATARNLAMQAFELPDPHCPHGRPVWIKITKDDLFNLIRRTEG